MKKLKRLVISLLTSLLVISSTVPALVYANETNNFAETQKEITTNSEATLSNEDYTKLTSEVKTIYTNLIQYDQTKNKFYVDEDKTEQYYNYDDESIKGVYLMKDSLNDELNNNNSSNYSEIINQKISEIDYVLQGNDINNLIPSNTRVKRSADFSWIQRCLEEAWGYAISLVTLKGIINLFKAGKFEAAAAKLASATAGRIAGMAALFAFVATCGATTVS
ncbi:membrane protein [Streptococcus pyogenes]|uniref:hypothetical protein n=1 Tax=Streptococcus pyogenes TaxID=1314 RepID=UPI00109D0A44|nr:hypothetical protein [Streptococcus pyogenes]VHC21911.1 membrane protein [Streptococcus pyogenes]VHC49720.1 membrane protein [Streptococcus pyogenes]VHC96326.1 membrane protein [Streptococcus pyogenes]VHE05154.1 membrane protein [Streptococcus pyogenes]